MNPTSVDDNSNSNNRTSSETQKSEQTTKTLTETSEVQNNDAATSVSLICLYTYTVAY